MPVSVGKRSNHLSIEHPVDALFVPVKSHFGYLLAHLVWHRDFLRVRYTFFDSLETRVMKDVGIHLKTLAMVPAASVLKPVIKQGRHEQINLKVRVVSRLSS